MGFHLDHLFFIPLIISVTGRRVKRRPRETIPLAKPRGKKFIWPQRYPTAALAGRVRPVALAPLRGSSSWKSPVQKQEKIRR
jgi:hypothetical protein